jgi:steroid 5-alpha reductase family enzyme
MIELLIYSLLMSIIFNLIVFLIAYYFQSDSLTDISYSLTFIFIAFIAFFLGNFSFYKIIYLVFILIWALRLGLFLFRRILFFKGRDKRFDSFRKRFLSFGFFFLVQGISVFIIMIPGIMFFNSEVVLINWVSFIGIFIWIKGFIFESISDYQKFKFIKNSKNKGKLMQSGLWAYSRHPNYYGEILCWIGLYLFVFNSLYGLGLYYAIFGIISPVYIFLIIRFFSGISILEKRNDLKFKGNKEYLVYKKRTPLLIPRFF